MELATDLEYQGRRLPWQSAIRQVACHGGVATEKWMPNSKHKIDQKSALAALGYDTAHKEGLGVLYHRVVLGGH